MLSKITTNRKGSPPSHLKNKHIRHERTMINKKKRKEGQHFSSSTANTSTSTRTTSTRTTSTKTQAQMPSASALPHQFQLPSALISPKSSLSSTFLLLLLNLPFLLLPQLLLPVHGSSNSAEHFGPRFGPPRFKQNTRTHQFAYLGDTIRLKCNAVGRPQPKVHWYREGQYLNYSFLSAHPRLKEKAMTLEVRRIEVGDRGNWTCRVWNNEGSTSRNFTLHIVDFCDYFLNVHIHPRRVPEECLCQWAIQQRDSQAAPDLYHLRALPQLRADLDLSEFVQNTERCQKYAKVEEIARLRAQPREELPRDELASSDIPTTAPITRSTSPVVRMRIVVPAKSAVPAPLPSSTVAPTQRPKWRPALKNFSAKLELARHLVRGSKQQIGRRKGGGDDEDEEDEESEEMETEVKAEKSTKARTAVTKTTRRPSTISTRTPTSNSTPTSSSTPTPSTSTSSSTRSSSSSSTRLPPWTERSTRPPAWLTTTGRWSLPQRVPPYFRQLEENIQTNIVIPAGRTLKLSCKAGGQPEPQVVWRKGNEEILRDTESKTGSLFHLRRWSLELEDAAEIDSGDYTCEVFNSAGSVVRHFRVEVQDRIRSRPILVPNVLQNQTIDVNGTVRFTCQVISDLVPHVIWIRLIHQNGSYLRWDPKEQRQTLNFLDLSKLDRARIFHDRHANRFSMELSNVSMVDQGIYSCVAGNTLGLSMANATLTVNEFRSLTLPTEVPVSWPLSYTVLLILSFLLLCAFVALCMLYLFFSKKFSAKNRVQTLDKMAVRKKVVITKKPQRDGWSDLASSYSITVEPVPVLGGGSGGIQGRGGTRGGGTDGDTIPLMGSGQGQHPNLDSSLLSDYEVPTDMAWEIDRDRLQLLDILGEGAFGEVWRGMLRPRAEDDRADIEPLQVAVKRLKPAAQERELIILVSEMQILKSIGHHPNILRLIGCCTGLGPLLVVLELCEHGNLRDFLRRHRPGSQQQQSSADWEEEERSEEEEGLMMMGEGTSSRSRGPGLEQHQRSAMYQNVDATTTEAAGASGDLIGSLQRQLTLRDLVQFATEIARGMDFLASKKIIHRDLAARNVLVAKDMSMKISDFGLSRNVFYHDYYRKRGAGRLPIKWMAPEALEANVYTVHSDVWSYGILLWEIMTLGGTPYPSIAMPQLYNLLKEGYRMEAPHNCPEEIYGVMVNCWQEQPEARPPFRTIADYFDWMLAEAEKTTAGADSSRSDTEETGETTATEEGNYAVIPEAAQQQQMGRPGAGADDHWRDDGPGTSGADARQQPQPRSGGGRQQRPQSVPGLMNFEVFSRELAAAPPTGPAAEASGQSLLRPTRAIAQPERRSLLEQLREVFSFKGGADQPRDSNLVDLEAGRPTGAGQHSAESGSPLYKNLLQQRHSPQSATGNFYANSPADAAVTASDHHQPQPGPSSSIESFPPPGCCSSGQSAPPRRPKKSIASEHGLRVQGVVLFAGIAEQNEQMKGTGGSSGGRDHNNVKGSSASFGCSPPAGHSCLHEKLAPNWRSPSMDSGHGNSSSAMSSADALGPHPETVKEEEPGQDSPPVGQTVEYVTIAPIGQFPA